MRTSGALLSCFLLFSGVAIGVACSSSDDTGGAPDGGNGLEAGAASCDPGVTVSNAECNPSTSIVCNVVGTSVTCCPPTAPFVCPANNECYATAADAFEACGSQPHTCLACPVPVGPDASTGDDAGDDSPSTPDSPVDTTDSSDSAMPDANDASEPDANDASMPDAADASTAADADDGSTADADDGSMDDAADAATE